MPDATAVVCVGLEPSIVILNSDCREGAGSRGRGLMTYTVSALRT